MGLQKKNKENNILEHEVFKGSTPEKKLEFYRRFYEEHKNKKSFASTKFFKTRILVIISLILLVLISTAFIPQSQTTAELNPFSYVFMLAFLFLIAFIDQIFFALYLWKKHSDNYKELFN